MHCSEGLQINLYFILLPQAFSIGSNLGPCIKILTYFIHTFVGQDIGSKLIKVYSLYS